MYANICGIVVIRSILPSVRNCPGSCAASTYEAELLLEVEGHSDNG